MEVTIRRRKFEIYKKKVLQALKNTDPQRIVRYFIEINGIRYPIKQVIAIALKLPPMEFNSQQAYQILQDLGFKIKNSNENWVIKENWKNKQY